MRIECAVAAVLLITHGRIIEYANQIGDADLLELVELQLQQRNARERPAKDSSSSDTQ